MAIASYTTDLQTINLAENITGVTALGGGASGLSTETDYYIQGSACISKAAWNSTATRGFIYDFGSGVTLESGSAIFYWGYWTAPNALNNQSLGGFQCLIGSSTTAYKQYYVRGEDTYTYGGWFNVPVDPSQSADTTTGTPTSTLQTFGILVAPDGAVAKGNPLGMDALRYGRRLFVTNGEVGAYGTFLSASVVNDSGSNRWGLFQKVDGGYLQQGIFQIGSGSTACDFRDLNRNINIANTEKVSPSFNRFEFVNTGTNVDWETINVTALGTNAPGDFLIRDNITGSFDRCTFAGMGYFTLKPNSTFTNCTWRDCIKVYPSQSLLDTCTIVNANTTAGTAFIVTDDPSKIQDCSFTYSDGHAIEITVTGSFTFSGNTFTDYTANNTSGSALFNNSGGPVTMSIAGGGDTPTYRNSTGSSTLILNNISVTITGLKDNTEIRVFDNSTSNPQVELAGVENATDGTSNNRSFTFSLTAGTIVDIVVINLTYENERIEAYTIPTSDTTLPIQQRIDRNYSNS